MKKGAHIKTETVTAQVSSPSQEFIPVYRPSLDGNEKRYVNDCLDSTWISSKGKYIELFERQFCSFTGAQHGVSVCNGTVAIHLALVALGIGAGDEVIVPTLTYVASVNTIVHAGATPVFVDSERNSWNMDPEAIRRRITPKTRAIMVVHLYGHPADMHEIMAIAKEHGLYVIEDAAEAFGSRIDGQHVGTFGDIATFSFFGNKTITTGEGGIVVTQDAELAARARHLRGQGLVQDRTYWHDVVAYNYRMTNICAALGVAQLERAPDLIARKLSLAAHYDRLLAEMPVETHRAVRPGIQHSFWMYSVLVPRAMRDRVMASMREAGVETRPLFYPVHTMPMYAEDGSYPVAEELGARGINLPSWPDMRDDQVAHVVAALSAALQQ